MSLLFISPKTTRQIRVMMLELMSPFVVDSGIVEPEEEIHYRLGRQIEVEVAVEVVDNTDRKIESQTDSRKMRDYSNCCYTGNIRDDKCRQTEEMENGKMMRV